jgi:amino acid transporter
LLVLYGLGVTVGAGVFALVGEILSSAGDQAPLAFLVAGVIAGLTGISYMALVAQFPQAGGEAVYVRNGVGNAAGRLVGLGVVITGVISSAVVALAFAGYASTLVAVPERVMAVGIVALLCAVAWWGVRESVVLAAVVTVLEVGTLLVVVGFGIPAFKAEAIAPSFNLFADGAIGPVFAGAGIAFFAFIGFEDIANMAEETIDPRRTTPRAIAWTLGVTLIVYVALAVIAASLANRSEITESSAPMTVIFSEVSGLNSAPIATIASLPWSTASSYRS